MPDSYFGQFTVVRIDANGEREILPSEDIYVYLESDDTELTDFTTDANGIIESALLSGIDPDTKVYFASKGYTGRLYQETKAVQLDAFQNPCTLVVETLYAETSETEVCDIYLEDLDGDVPTVFIGSVKPGGTLRVPYQPINAKTANIYKINRDRSGQMSTSKFQQAEKETITDATSRPTITIGTTQIVGVSTDKLIGRDSSGTGAAEQIGVSSKFSISSLTLDLVEANLTHNNIGGTLGISKGGSGQTTANAALNAFLPSQSGNSGKFLKTDGTNSAWESVSSGITIGSTSITSGTNNRILFQASGVVSQDADFTFDGSNNRLTVGSAILQTPNSTSLFLGGAPHASYSGANNVFVGIGAGSGNTNQGSNVYIGDGAGSGTSADAYFNVFIGKNSGAVTETRDNVFVGYNTGSANTTGTQNVFIGSAVGASNTTGSNSVLIGRAAGNANTTASITAIGYLAGYSNTTGDENAYYGSLAGYQTTTGHSNVFVGRMAGQANTTGYYGTFVGHQAGYNSTGIENTCIGRNSGINITTGTNNVMIGSGVQGDSATANNQTNINDTFIATSTEARISGRNFKIEDAKNIIFGTSTGTKIGASSSQKLGFWGVTPVTQRTLFGAITDGTGGTPVTTINIDDGMGGIDVSALNDALATIIARINSGRTIFSETGLAA